MFQGLEEAPSACDITQSGGPPTYQSTKAARVPAEPPPTQGGLAPC